MNAEPGSTENGQSRVSMLDEALWSRFDQSHDLGESARIWLALQTRQIDGIAGGAVVIDNGSDAFVPVARLPKDGAPDPALTGAIDAAIDRDAPAVTGGRAIALPLKIDGETVGAAGLVFMAAQSQPTDRLRQLRWGMGWLAEAARGTLMGRLDQDRARMSAVLDLTGTVLDARGFKASCVAAVNLLARATGSAQVGLGFVRWRLRLQALSDVADFRLNTGRTRALERAMYEAADQQGSVLHPARPDQEFMVDLAHADLRKDGNLGELLSVPMFDGDNVIGALHFQKPADESFSADEIMVAEGAAAILGPILLEKRLLDRTALGVFRDAARAHLGRLFGPRYLGRKIALLVMVGLVALFSVWTDDFRVKSDAEVQGQLIRSVGAPFDGNVAAQFARAGDRIAAGDILARLDDTDLRIELLRIQTSISRYEGEYDRALADRNAPEARIATANLDEARARAELISAQITRADLIAPFDAVIINGDLSQSLGAAVRRGQELYQIAPLDSYRVQVEVDERDLDEIQVGQTGALVLASLPGEEFPLRVTRITPRLTARDGLNVALVEAELDGEAPQIRPGMRGIAKIKIGQRLVIRNWTQPIIDWGRMTLWRWTP